MLHDHYYDSQPNLNKQKKSVDHNGAPTVDNNEIFCQS